MATIIGLDPVLGDGTATTLPTGDRASAQRGIHQTSPAPTKTEVNKHSAVDAHVERQFAARSASGTMLPVFTTVDSEPAVSRTPHSRPAAQHHYTSSSPREERGFWSSLWSGAVDLVSGAAYLGYQTARAVVGIAAEVIPQVASWAWERITHPAETLSAVGGFLKSISDSVGLTDLAVGLYSLSSLPFKAAWGSISTLTSFGADLFRVATGKLSLAEAFERLGENAQKVGSSLSDTFVQGLRSLKGGVLLLGELTGITDVVQCVGCLLKGDWKGALMHGAFALMSLSAIAATVATGGAAAGALVAVAAGRVAFSAATKQVVKVACKQFFKAAGEALGKELVADVSKTLTKDVLDAAAEKLAKDGVHSVATKFLGRDGAVKLLDAATPSHIREALAKELLEKAGPKEFEKAMAKYGEKTAAELMKTAQVSKKVADLVEDMLKKHSRMSLKDLEQEFLEKGFAKTEKEARMLAYRSRNIARGAGHSADKELADALTEGIMKPLREHVEAGMKEGYERQMRELLKGADKAKIDEAIEAGWKGAREGMEKSMQKAVRAGVHKGIENCRGDLRHFLMESLGTGEDEPTTYTISRPVNKAEGPAIASSAMGSEKDNSGPDAALRHPTQEVIVTRGSQLIRQTFELRGSRPVLISEVDLGGVVQTLAEASKDKDMAESTKKSRAAA